MTTRQDLDAARLAWKQAKLRLDTETDPELIDADCRYRRRAHGCAAQNSG